ncbi:MAG: TonB-dependent receptor domain-containing protein [Silanimonas lenta]
MLSTKPLSAAIALLLSATVTAQTTPATPPKDDTTTLDAVIVTGTHLRGVDLAESQPVQVIDAAQIERLGATTLGDILRLVSETGGGTGNFSTATSGALQADSPAGMAGASLRGLGAGSTLTLVNGRRITAAAFSNGVRSENFVDINALPTAAIDRIEVLSAGASAIYGADAVAGVINVVLRRDFDGVRVSLSYGDSSAATDEAKINANLVWGFGDSEAGGLLVVDAFRRNGFYNRDRALTRDERVPSQQGIFPSFNWGNLSRDDFVEAACPDAQRFDGRPGFPLGSLGAYCALDRSDYTAFDPDLELLGLYGSAHLRLGERLEAFGELQLQRNQSFASSAPAPWSNVRIAFNHPNFPAELRARMLAAGLGASEDIRGWGRFPDARRVDVTTRNWRVLAGLRGELGSQWGWESALFAGRSESEQRATAGIYHRDRILAGMRGRLCPDGRTTCTPATGGLWYNPFGGQASQDPRVLDLVREEVPRSGESSTLGLDFKLNGTAGRIGDRDIAWAFGLEGREERIADRPSPLAEVDRFTGVPGVFGFGSKSARAERSASAAFAEAFLPFAERFDLRLAARYDHYSDFGSDFNPSVGFRFRPLDTLVVRGGWNTGFRAPSLAQAGAGTTAASFTLPCGATSEFYTNFCANGAGVPPANQRPQTILSQIFANEDLKPETSEAWNLGAVWSPAERTTFSLDYWHFEQENLVDVDYFSLLRRALANPSLVYTYVDGSRPRPAGAIGIETASGLARALSGGEVFARLENIGVQRTHGWDFSAKHRLSDDVFGGRLVLDIDATRVNRFERSESCSASTPALRGDGPCVNGQRLVELNGEYRYPKWRGTVALDWTGEAHDLSLWAKYVGSYYDDFRFDPAAIRPSDRVGSWTTLNASWGWNIDAIHRLTLTIDNLLDRDPPRALGASAWVDTYNHSAMGRYLTLRWIGRF